MGAGQGVLPTAYDHPFGFGHLAAVQAMTVVGLPVGVVHVFLAM